MRFVRNKKGLSLVEVIIAMLLIAIMSAAVLSTVAVSGAIVSKNTDKLMLAYVQDNIVTCFADSNDLIQFERALRFCFGEGAFSKTETPDGYLYSMYFANNGQLVAQADSKYSVSFSATEQMLTLSTTDSKGKQMYSVTYPKGAQA